MVGIHALIAVAYTMWPKKAPAGAAERPAPAKAGRVGRPAGRPGGAQRSPPGTHSTSPTSLLAIRARMNRRSERRLR